MLLEGRPIQLVVDSGQVRFADVQESVFFVAHLSRAHLFEFVAIFLELILLFADLHDRGVQKLHTGIILNRLLPRPLLLLGVPAVQLVSSALQMREGHFCIFFVQTHHVFGVVPSVLGHQLPDVFEGIVVELFLLRDRLPAHQHSNYNYPERSIIAQL